MRFPPSPRLCAIVGVLLGLIAASAILAQTPAGPDPNDATFRRTSNRVLCQCGCNYLVLSCNHVDCASATYIRKTIRTALEAGKSEDVILASFVEQYGAKILPEPPREGFAWLAWIMPFLALGLGGGAVSYVLWHWKPKPVPEGPVAAATSTAGSLAPSPAASSAVVEKYRSQIDQELEEE